MKRNRESKRYSFSLFRIENSNKLASARLNRLPHRLTFSERNERIQQTGIWKTIRSARYVVFGAVADETARTGRAYIRVLTMVVGV